MLLSRVKNLEIEKDEERPCRIFSITANISAGKSSLCDNLRKHKHLFFIVEPVWLFENWYCDETKKHINVLDLYYKGLITPSRSQSIIAKIMLEYHNEQYAIAIAAGYKTIVMDRSLLDGIYTFCRLLEIDPRVTTAAEVNIDRFYSHLIPHTFIHLETSPVMCLERLHNRSRTCECDMTLEYLVDLDAVTSSFMSEIPSSKKLVVRVDELKMETMDVYEYVVKNTDILVESVQRERTLKNDAVTNDK